MKRLEPIDRELVVRATCTIILLVVIIFVAVGCDYDTKPKPSPSPTRSVQPDPPPPSPPAPSPRPPTPRPTATPSSSATPVAAPKVLDDLQDPPFDTCREAKEAGYGPYDSESDLEYFWYDDRDSDGVVCE